MDDSRFVATNDDLARTFGSKVLRYADTLCLAHLDNAINALSEAWGWADLDERKAIERMIKDTKGIRDDIAGEG